VPATVTEKCDVGVQSEKEEPSTWKFSDHPTVKAVFAKQQLPPIQIFPLQFVKADVAGYICTALNDSGCQIPVVSERKFGWCMDGAVGTVNLHGFGWDHVVQAPLVRLTVRLCSGSECMNDSGECFTEQAAMPLVCAVALPSNVVQELVACNSSVTCVSVDSDECTSVSAQVVEESVQDRSDATNEDVLSVDSLPRNDSEGDTTALVAEQKADPTLARWWRQADSGKGNFLIYKNLLYY